MIISRSSLQVLNIIKNDKVPVLNNVHITQDGTVIGSNGKCIILVSPVTKEVRNNLKELIGDDPINDPKGVTISEEAGKDVLKNMPKDTQFKGLLEHVNVIPDEEDHRAVEFKLTDGKRPKAIRGRRWERDYIEYQKVLDRVNRTKEVKRVVLNRKRLLSLLDTIDKACTDTSGNSAVFLEFSEANDIIVRGVNYANGQRMIGVMQSYKGNEGEWLEQDEWEKKIWGIGVQKENIKIKKISCKIPKKIV
jgi:hypothetical protein